MVSSLPSHALIRTPTELRVRPVRAGLTSPCCALARTAHAHLQRPRGPSETARCAASRQTLSDPPFRPCYQRTLPHADGPRGEGKTLGLVDLHILEIAAPVVDAHLRRRDPG